MLKNQLYRIVPLSVDMPITENVYIVNPEQYAVRLLIRKRLLQINN